MTVEGLLRLRGGGVPEVPRGSGCETWSMNYVPQSSSLESGYFMLCERCPNELVFLKKNFFRTFSSCHGMRFYWALRLGSFFFFVHGTLYVVKIVS